MLDGVVCGITHRENGVYNRDTDHMMSTFLAETREYTTKECLM